MSNLTISIFGNKIFLEILDELKLFSKFKIEYYKDLDFLNLYMKSDDFTVGTATFPEEDIPRKNKNAPSGRAITNPKQESSMELRA